jgi:hypothetical protein
MLYTCRLVFSYLYKQECQGWYQSAHFQSDLDSYRWYLSELNLSWNKVLIDCLHTRGPTTIYWKRSSPPIPKQKILLSTLMIQNKNNVMIRFRKIYNKILSSTKLNKYKKLISFTFDLFGCNIHRYRSYAIATIINDDMNIGVAWQALAARQSHSTSLPIGHSRYRI